MKVVIFHPRVDQTFKSFGETEWHEVTSSYMNQSVADGIATHRLEWFYFTQNLKNYHHDKGDDVIEVIRPLWAFTPEDLKLYSDADRFYIPHHDKKTFPGDDRCYYYMQTVFPHLFTVDKNGWGADLTNAPFNPALGTDSGVYEQYQQRITSNESKFAQPSKPLPESLKDGYALFVCQLPHDQTIKLHSSVSVEDALRDTIRWTKEQGIPLVIKGHPANPGAMGSLRRIHADGKWGVYTDAYSIHALLSKCRVAVMVNSGVGFEAILHGKPVIAYGRSEYAQVINTSENKSLDRLSCDIEAYKKFFDVFVKNCVDTSNMDTYTQL